MNKLSKNLLFLFSSILLIFIVIYIVFLNIKEGFSSNDVTDEIGNIGNKITEKTNYAINQLDDITNQSGDVIQDESGEIGNQPQNIAYQTGGNIQNEFVKIGNRIAEETNHVIKQLQNIAYQSSDAVTTESTSVSNSFGTAFNKYIIQPIVSAFYTITNSMLFYLILIILSAFSLLYIIIRFTLLRQKGKSQDNLNNVSPDTNTNIMEPNINIYRRSLFILFGLVISGIIIFLISYNITNTLGNSSIASIVLIVLLVVVILGLIYKTINVKTPTGNSKKNGFFNLIFTTLLYIPCLLSGGFDWIGKLLVGQYNATNAGSILMLILAISLFILYLYTPSVFNLISTQGGTQLVNMPVYTDSQYNLGGYQDLNGSDEYDYQFAISCWIFLDAAGPNMNANYNKYTSLLNFGDKPNVLYNGKKNSFMVTMKQKNLQDVTKNKLTDFDSQGNRIIYVNDNMLLQKWNNLIINYNGGTLDIFLNGELVNSSIEVVPYYTFENLTIGENDGIKGGICNVVYFRRALTAQNIYYIYNTLKDRTPPILNNSNKTILVKT